MPASPGGVCVGEQAGAARFVKEDGEILFVRRVETGKAGALYPSQEQR